MNLQQRGSRYGFGVHFAAGAAGVLVLAAGISEGLAPSMEIWLSAALIVVVLLHARLGFAFGRAQAELEMLRKLAKRVKDDPARSLKKAMPRLKVSEEGDVGPDDVAVLDKVKEAIEADRVDLYLQPIVSLPQRKPRFFEAYSRLHDESGRILKPAYYLDAAERANRIGVIDNMILLRCIQALREQSKDNPRLTVFCNLSPATLYDSDFFADFTDYLEANNDLTSKLIFEFTYPAVQMMHPKVEENLKSIADKGFVFSVDHVHTLDVDLEALKSRNFGYVKIASSILLAAGSGDEVQTAKLATFRKRLADAGIDLIAEKIEREEDMPAIAALRLDYGEGNLFGAPRPATFYLPESPSVEAPVELAKVS